MPLILIETIKDNYTYKYAGINNYFISAHPIRTPSPFPIKKNFMVWTYMALLNLLYLTLHFFKNWTLG